jgi:hypothetical protein
VDAFKKHFFWNATSVAFSNKKNTPARGAFAKQTQQQRTAPEEQRRCTAANADASGMAMAPASSCIKELECTIA